MATIPSFESLLLEIHQSLGLVPFTSKVKDKFSDLGMPIDNQADMAEEVLAAIFKALDMDHSAQRAAMKGLRDWKSFHKALEINTWTSNADQRQILWHLLGYSFTPGLARRVAFWNLEGTFDKGMPGGEFWFLPHLDQTTGQVILPVPQVVRWLLDLLGLPMDQAKHVLGGKSAEEDSMERNLYLWKKGNLPKVQTIKDYFSEDTAPAFKGVFLLADGLSEETRFTNAIDFVRKVKHLDAEGLRDQIPMTQPGRLEAILDGSAPGDEKELFVDLLLVRYGQPSMHTIRQRLLVARMVQDGYRRLLKFLCPGVEETCTDPSKNKLLQLAGIFGVIYNLTIDAWKNTNNEGEENARFEAQLPPWDKAGIFISILPSKRGHGYLELANLLTRRFAKLAPGAELEDIAGLDMESAMAITEAKVLRLAEEADEDLRIANVLRRIRRGSPPRKALQGEVSYSVVVQIANSEELSATARLIAVARLKELARTEDEKLSAITIELHTLLNCGVRDRPQDVQQKVHDMLTEAEASSAWSHWKAPLLQYRAKHCLAQNDFDRAGEDFREALEACRERNYGKARGEIARDALATEVADLALIPKNQEKYFRNMLAYGMFEQELGKKPPSLEDTAIWASEYFWSDLYKPYPGVEERTPMVAAQATAFLEQTLPLIAKADWDGLGSWMQRHAKAFRKTRIRDARGGTVLLSWLKMLDTFKQRLPGFKDAGPSHLQGAVPKFEAYLANWHQAISLLASAWPEQLNISDFKGQTPLMLAADAGDDVLVGVFVDNGADINIEEYQGRTALYAAAVGRSEACVAILLEKCPDMGKVTKDEHQSVLHTAVRMGHPGIVRLLLAHDPSLKSRQNIKGQTPLTLADDILKDLPTFRTVMAKHKRQIGSLEDFEEVVQILKVEPTIH